MALTNAEDQYLTYEGRLETFKNAPVTLKKRSSNASTRASKKTKWPHKNLKPEDFAQAGFCFRPTEQSLDNVVCFLCGRNMDGWDDDDDPLAEHLKHSEDCGWAITQSVAQLHPELSVEFPASTKMVEARKATFGDKWPHETKKGWKCKVKKMVEAGWIYTPLLDSDDMATCSYCHLALDGWENVDKPLENHYSRSTDCPFFTLIDSQEQNSLAKKGKKGRTSKASRVSTQSSFVVQIDAPSVITLEAEDDSGLMTGTAETSLQGGRRIVKGKRAATGKGRKTRAKQNEVSEAVHASEPENDEVEVEPAKANSSRKRRTDDMVANDVGMDAPAPKRRTTRNRRSLAVDDSVLDASMNDASVVGSKGRSAPKPRGRQPKKQATRSSRGTSTTRIASLALPDEKELDELDRALEADLDQRLTDDEKVLEPVVPKNKRRKVSKPDHVMFGLEPMEIDEAAIDAELAAMEQELQSKARGKPKRSRKVPAKQEGATSTAVKAEAERLSAEEASQQIVAELEHSITLENSSPVVEPKRKRAASRQGAKKGPAKAIRSVALSVDEIHVGTTQELDDTKDGYESDASAASQSTVIRCSSSHGSTSNNDKSDNKESSRKIEDIVGKKGTLPNDMELDTLKEVMPAPDQKFEIYNRSMTEDVFYSPLPEAPPSFTMVPKPRGRPPKATQITEPAATQAITDIDASVASNHGEDIALAQTKVLTPEPSRSATPPLAPQPREKTPSQSPQSSDAENHPPLSQPLAAAKNKTSTPTSQTARIPFAAAVSTPHLSPSKRNIISHLQSSRPWTRADLEIVFIKSPSADEIVTDAFDTALQKIKHGQAELIKEEMEMTVEEWIQHIARLADEKLRGECEFMVGCFEREGGRAMSALEGIECSV